MTERLLICTDLDRTLIPNGHAPESDAAREIFSAVVRHDGVVLAYVSGRNRALIELAIGEYDLPMPDWVLADVGTTLFEVRDGLWEVNDGWREQLRRDWPDGAFASARRSLAGLAELAPQDPTRQGDFKLSYALTGGAGSPSLRARVRAQLDPLPFPSQTVWSRDDTTGVELLDVLPRCAGKRFAVDFLRGLLGLGLERTVFSGDSGNDLDVLTSEIPSVLVANASEAVRSQALSEARARGNQDSLYLARGGWRGLNGNYAGGILEGLCHFVPAVEGWLP